MYKLHRFPGVSNLEYATVDHTCVRKGISIKQKLDKKKNIFSNNKSITLISEFTVSYILIIILTYEVVIIYTKTLCIGLETT